MDSTTLCWKLAIVAVLLSLNGCGTTQTAQPLSITGGTVSAMNSSNTSERNALSIIPSALPTPPRYSPIAPCTYHQIHSPLGGPLAMTQFTMTLRPVRDRLLITFNDRQGVGTALIGTTGRLYDFNMMDITTGLRFTTENYSGAAQAGRTKTEAANNVRADIINPVSTMFPEYVAAYRDPGSEVAFVFNSEGGIWASYVHRGLTSFNGRQAAVLDLVRTLESSRSNRQRTIGFSVVDLATMVPLLLVLDAGYQFRLERLSCP